LLAKAGITSKGIAQYADQQSRWSSKLSAALDPALFERVTGTGFEAGTLTVYVESAAWSARLRYALAESLPQLQEAETSLTAVSVRLRPRPAPSDTHQAPPPEPAPRRPLRGPARGPKQ
jgi:Dna[CI] antecedent, DciA